MSDPKGTGRGRRTPWTMLARLLAVALIGLTLTVLVVAGVVMAVVIGLAALNVMAVILGVVIRQRRSRPTASPETPAVVQTHRITGRQAEAFPQGEALPSSSEVPRLQ